MKLALHFLACSLSLAAIFAAPIDDTIPLIATSADILKLQPGSHVVHNNKELIETRPVRQSHQLTRPSPINPDVIVDPPPPTSEATILVTPVADVKSADWHRESGTPLSVAVPTTEVEQLPKEAKATDAVKPAETKTVAEDKPRLARDAESVKEEKKTSEETKPIAPEEVKEDKPKLLLSRGSTKFGAHKEETEDKKITAEQKDATEKVEQARPSRSTPAKVEDSPKTEQDKPIVDAPLLVKKCDKPKSTNEEVKRPSRNVPANDVEKPKAALAEPQHASGHQVIKEEVAEKKPEIEQPKVTIDEIKRPVRNTPPKVEAAETKKEDTKVTVEEAKIPSSRPVIKEDATVKKAEDKAVAELPTESKTLKHKRMIRGTDRLSSNDDKKKNNREEITNYPDEKYDNEGPHFSFPVPVSKILGAKTIKYPHQNTDEEGTEESPAEESSQ